jgi:hypothetical protein
LRPDEFSQIKAAGAQKVPAGQLSLRRPTGHLRPASAPGSFDALPRNAVVYNGILESGIAFLPKSFSIEQLANKVWRALDAR